MLRSQSFPRTGSNMSHFIHSREMRYFSHKRPWPYCMCHTSYYVKHVTKFLQVMLSLHNSVLYALHWPGRRPWLKCHPCWDTKADILQHKMGTLQAPTYCHSSLGIQPDLVVWIYMELKRNFWLTRHSKICGKRDLYGALETNYLCYYILRWLSRYNEISTSWFSSFNSTMILVPIQIDSLHS
jgi:hypothetical protein